MGMLWHRHIRKQGGEDPRPAPKVEEKAEATQPKKRGTKKAKTE